MRPTVIVTNASGLRGIVSRIDSSSGPIGFDTEFSGPEVAWRGKTWLDWYSADLTGLSLSVDDWAWYIPVAHHADGPNLTENVRPFLEWIAALPLCSRRVWCHNLKAEFQILRNTGVQIDTSVHGWADSQVAAWLAGWGSDHKSLALKKLAAEHGYGSSDTFAEFARKRQARDIPVAEIAPYAGRDAWLTKEIGEKAYAELVKHDLANHFWQIDMPCVEICRSIEAWGVTVDNAMVREQMTRLSDEARILAEDFKFLTTTTVDLPVKERVASGEFYKNGKPKLKTIEVLRPFEIGAVIGNDHQVSRWCYDELRVWPTDGLKLNGAHHWPVDKETLERFTILPGLGGQLAQMRLDWAWRDKLCKTYLRPLLELPPQYRDGRLHGNLNLTGTGTQRFSSSSPNLQNVPSRTEEGRAIRRALRARAGWTFLIYDYSQIELRIMAHLSRDPEMCACYDLDIDIHGGTLARLQKYWPDAQRVHAKTTNFSTIYRISPPSLAIKMKSSIPAAEASITAFYETHPGVRDYHEAAIEYAAEHGYARTIDGFKRFLDVAPKFNYRTKRREMLWSVQNEAINTPIQGSAAGLTKLAMIAMHRRWIASGEYGVRVNLAGQEHDAIIVEARDDFADEAYAHMKIDMESAMRLRVPIIAEGGRGPSWAEAKH
jgi:DNA polymerase-1